jgi:DNA-binding Lrp family transcriptional regulator
MTPAAPAIPAGLKAWLSTRNVTPRQLEMVAWFYAYQQENGIAPVMQEVADAMGVSKVTVWEHVRELKRKGWRGACGCGGSRRPATWRASASVTAWRWAFTRSRRSAARLRGTRWRERDDQLKAALDALNACPDADAVADLLRRHGNQGRCRKGKGFWVMPHLSRRGVPACCWSSRYAGSRRRSAGVA